MMDATMAPSLAVATAHRWGHAAVAITDHGNVQGFPDAMKMSEKLGMKVIYGMEGYLVDDAAKAIFGEDDTGFDDEFVVFDIETTGLSAMTCKITEIGAVLVQKGEVLKVFSTFVNPEGHIPEEITELTGITDDMVSERLRVSNAPWQTQEALSGSPMRQGDMTGQRCRQSNSGTRALRAPP